MGGRAITPIWAQLERWVQFRQSRRDLSWLDACEDHKVVYVCFGSQAILTNNQMEKFAFGLEKSGV